MRHSTISLMALGIISLWACNRVEETALPEGVFEGTLLTVKATLADNAKTRTVLNSDKSIYWTKDDAINLFYGSRSSGKFVSSIEDEPQKTTDFVGTLTVATGSSEEGMSAQAFWGVYPYDENNTCDGEGVTMTIPSEQEALAGSFADKLNPSVATSPGLNLAFYNVGAPFYFSVTQEGVTSATFKGNNNEDVAGKIYVTMDSDGYPVAEVVEGVKSITLTAPEGGFVVGTTYVIVLLPQAEMSAGYTVTFKKGNLEADWVVTKSVKFERSKGRSKVDADEGLEYAVPFIPEAVDLGLPSGLKWGSFNLGASAPEEYGDYYAWGETEPYYSSQDPLTWKDGKEAGYEWASYKWCMGSNTTLTKYCSSSKYGYNGFTDTKTVLDSEDDAASVNLGGKWRMPTDADWTELREKCTWTWTTQNGVTGHLVTASNGNSIFLPAAGYRFHADFGYAGSYGNYRSSSLAGSPDYTGYLAIESDGVYWGYCSRCDGLSVRPVYDEFISDEFISVESVSLNKTSLSLLAGSTDYLTVSISPGNATEKTVTWISSDTFVATVSSDGVVTALSAGSATITVWASDGVHSATCNVTVTEAPEHAYVDMGNGLKWATMNVGASSETDYGDYFAWGETEPHYESVAEDGTVTWKTGYEAGYAWSNYKWCEGSITTLTKYNTDSSYGIVDNKTILEAEDDAATVNWGSSWRTPTDDEWTWLRENCTWTWTDDYNGSGVAGRIVTSNVEGYTNNSIFLPAAGFRYDASRLINASGYYRSSSLDTVSPDSAWHASFRSSNVGRSSTLSRCNGLSVRPVTE